MRIYCQYSVAGYRTFQLTSLPHSTNEMKYVRMKEISDAQSADSQQIMITRKCDCDLDKRIASLFSSHNVSLLLLHNTGKDGNDIVLYVNDIETKTTFAFATQDKNEIDIIAKLACLWLNEKHNVLVERLSSLVGKVEVDAEPVFAFQLGKWKQIESELSNVTLNTPLYRKIMSGKNVLSNMVIGKRNILRSAGINIPLSSFVCVPGNETVAEIEMKRKIIRYSVIGLTTIAAVGVLVYCFNK